MVLYVGVKVDKGVYAFTPTQQISQDLNIPASTASMILRSLSRSGLIETREGANGGVRLARSPDKITLLDVFSAVEQQRPLFQTNFQVTVTGEKVTRARQAINQALDASETAMKQSLQAITIKDLMKTTG